MTRQFKDKLINKLRNWKAIYKHQGLKEIVEEHIKKIEEV